MVTRYYKTQENSRITSISHMVTRYYKTQENSHITSISHMVTHYYKTQEIVVSPASLTW